MLLSSLFQNFSHTSGLSSLPSFRSLKSAKPADVSKRTSIVKSCELREREGKRTKAFEPKKSSNGERKKGSENIGVELSARFGHFFSSFFSLSPSNFREQKTFLCLSFHTYTRTHPRTLLHDVPDRRPPGCRRRRQLRRARRDARGGGCRLAPGVRWPIRRRRGDGPAVEREEHAAERDGE